MKRFYLSSTDKKIAGVCGGYGEYFEIDSTVVRIIFVVLALSAGLGLLTYLVTWIVAPKQML